MKVKINNIDEFCTSLKAGYLIINNCHDNLIFENGKIIARFAPAGRVQELKINELFFYKPDLLKIKCGKYYKTRDGRKAAVMFKDESSYPFYGMIENSPEPFSWDKRGKNAFCADYDLVSEWKECK